MIYLSEKTVLKFDLNIVAPQDEAASTVGEAELVLCQLVILGILHNNR